MNTFASVTPMRALELVEAAGIIDARRIIADFAAAGLVKSYAGVMETIDARGASTCVRGPAIPAAMWQRVIKAGVADDVWATGTVRLDGADLVGGAPAAVLTAVTFKAESIDLVIAHHVGTGRSRKRHAKPSEAQDAAVEGQAAIPPEPDRKRQGELAGIPPGALIATVAQTMQALGKSRGTIMNLIERGVLIRRNTGLRSVDIEVASILALAGAQSAEN